MLPGAGCQLRIICRCLKDRLFPLASTAPKQRQKLPPCNHRIRVSLSSVKSPSSPSTHSFFAATLTLPFLDTDWAVVRYWRHPQSPNGDLRLLTTTKNLNKNKTRTPRTPRPLLSCSTSELPILPTAPNTSSVFPRHRDVCRHASNLEPPQDPVDPTAPPVFRANFTAYQLRKASPGSLATPPLSPTTQPPLSITTTSGRKYPDRNHGRHTGHQHRPHQLSESWLV